MQQADSCMAIHPDSALSYLFSLKDNIRLEPEETQMYFHLLTIKANDKLYIPHTSDSLIKAIVQFYESYGDNTKLTEAYYYLAGTYRDLNDIPQALKAYQLVVDTYQKNKPANDLLGKTYNQMGLMFAYQGLYKEALEINKKSAAYYLSQGKATKGSYAVRDIARMYNAINLNDSALHYYQKAYQMTLADKDSNRIYGILGEIGCFYYGIGQKNTAKQIIINAIDHKEKMENAFLVLGYIYKDNHQWDSAYYYFNETLKYGDIHKRCHTYQYLFSIETEKGNYHQAINYIQKAITLRDSIDVITQTEAVAKINSLYNYQHTEKENNQLKLNNENQKTVIYQLILILLVLIGVSVGIFIYLKKRKDAASEQERKIRVLKEQQYTQSLAAIKTNQKELNELEQQLNVAEVQNDILKQQLFQAQKELLELSNRRIIAIHNKQDLLIASLQQSDIYLLFHKAGNDESLKITEEHWQKLQAAIDVAFQNFTNRLYTYYPQLSLQELRICYLIKISIPVKDIATFVNRSKSAITVSRSRLYKKIHGTDGNAEMFDNFIADL